MNLDTLIVSIAALLPLVGSFLVVTAFVIGGRRVYCARRRWSDVRVYTMAHLDRAICIGIFVYFFWVRIIAGQNPPETFQSFIGSLLLGSYFLTSVFGQLSQANDRWGILGKGRNPMRNPNATHAGD